MLETVDAAHMRAMNSSILLKLIWKDRQISRADISRLTGMSRSTVSAIVSDLMRGGLVSETGIGHSNGGRRPVILSFNEDAYSILGIELTAQSISAALLNLNGSVQYWVQKPCDTAQDPQAALRVLEEVIAEVETLCARSSRPLIGVGVSLPAPVLATSGALPFLEAMFPAWKDLSLRDFLIKRTGVPVVFEKDANLGALAELWWGASKGEPAKNLVCLKIGRGLGAGIIIDGKIYHGARGLAGELGQVLLGHARTRGGRLPDVNSFIGAKGLSQRQEELRTEHTHSALPAGSDLKTIFAAAEKGDALALTLLDEAAVTLGVAISNLLVLLDVDRVVIGGTCTPALRQRLLEVIRRTVREQTIWPELQEAVISESPLGEQQVAIGAATMLLEKALNELSFFKKTAVSAIMADKNWSDEEGFAATQGIN